MAGDHSPRANGHAACPILDEAFEIFGDKSEYVVAAPQYRAAAITKMS
jgi:hypothetical protein